MSGDKEIPRIEKKFLIAIEKLKITPNADDKILLAISGGVDSMVLLSLFLKFGFTPVIAHCNYKLRGVDSDEDEVFVINTAHNFGVEVFSKDFHEEIKKYSNIQLAARHLRYNWFNKICNQQKLKFIATAHHCNDSIETLFVNLIRGTSLKGLCGIPFTKVNIIRPLLGIFRQEIIAYALEHKLKWREDISNSSDKYIRNKIRHHVIPVLKQLNPRLEKTFINTFLRLNMVQNFWQEEIDKIYKQHVSLTKNQGCDDSVCTIETDSILNKEHGVMILSEILNKFGFSFNQVHSFFSKKHISGARLVSKNHILELDRNTASVREKKSNTDKKEFLYCIQKAEERVKIKSFELKFERFLHSQQMHFSPSNDLCYLDEDLLEYPMSLRFFVPGDWFCPFGMKGRKKKISDFFVDLKISNEKKITTPLLISNNAIVWVVGMRADERFKISESTRKVLQISIIQDPIKK